MKAASPPPSPYKFQLSALARLETKFFDENVQNVVLVSPTGSGKTVMAAHAMQDPRFERVRCISHRVSINDQNRTLLCPTYTPQSLKNGLPEDFGKPDLVIWEECHHSEAPTFKAIRKKFPKAKMLGLTATPQRADGLALDLFDDLVVAAHYSELLLNKTIVPCQVEIPTAFYDDREPDLVKAFLRYREPSTRALFFCRSIEQAEDTASRLKRVQPFHCGKTSKWNREVLAAFKAGQLEGLTTVDALGEGIDVPDANLLVLGRKCDNVSTYLQYCGRVMRAAERKDFARIIDCVGASIRHGSPTEDREYTITGAGIQRRGGGGDPNAWEREAGDRQELRPYDADFRTLYGWKNATDSDKRRQLGWLRQIAGRHGYTESVAEQCFVALFDHAPTPDSKRPSAAPPSAAAPSTRRKSVPPSAHGAR
jgi:superfamily II DNA or RNA helicase